MSTATSTHVEFRVIGPPGCGKTTFLCRQVGLALAARGWSPADPWAKCPVLISSLTRSAAAEVAGRGLALPEEAVGTLHSHALRALGRPKLCVDKPAIEQWNAVCEPQHRLTVGRGSDAPDRDASSKSPGDSRIEEYHVARAKLKPRELWPTLLAAFAAEYETWKRTAGYLDFDDLIHDAFEHTHHAPGSPEILFIDEAQDHDRAELRLIRRWAEAAERVIIVGDPDQNLYEWRGSEPEAFYEHEIPEENKRTLAQSYRVPRAVHAAAVRMIERCRGRVPVEYHPRDADGELRRFDGLFAAGQVDWLIRDAARYIDAGKSVMFLAACEYQLRPLIAELRASGTPFWNPFAKDRAHFNPLHPGRGTSTASRVLAYFVPSEALHGDMARVWTPHEVHLWTDICLASGLLRRGAKAAVEKLAGEQRDPLSGNQLRELFEPDALAELDEVGPEFLRSRCCKDRLRSVDYALAIIRRRGPSALANDPRIVVGTIHSVKGAEADAVYVCPDLSTQGYDQLDSRYPDPVYRQFYVAMTRARESLILCEQTSTRAIEW